MPRVVTNAAGGWRLYFISESGIDGLTFEQDRYDVFFGNDPDVLRLVDGTLVVYYGQFDPQVGGTINLARCPDPGAATPTAGRRPL